jgi:hypothetical protein
VTTDNVLEDVRVSPDSAFLLELESLINKYSKENGSNTPDYILADYLLDCLNAFDKSVRARHKWFGHPEPFVVE